MNLGILKILLQLITYLVGKSSNKAPFGRANVLLIMGQSQKNSIVIGHNFSRMEKHSEIKPPLPTNASEKKTYQCANK